MRTLSLRSTAMPLLALVLLLAAALCWAAVEHEARPNRSELRNHVHVLAAHAAEAELLASMSARPAASVFARVHAIQLIHRVEATRGDIDTMQHDPALAKQAERARELAERLVQQVHTLTMAPVARPINVSAPLGSDKRSLLVLIAKLERELQP